MVHAFTSVHSSAIGRRETSRLKVRLPIKVITRKSTTPAILLDLSYFGARIQCREQLGLAEELLLQWDGVEAFGQTVWIGGYGAGIQFIEPLAPRDILHTRDLDDSARLPSEWEMNCRAARDWANGRDY